MPRGSSRRGQDPGRTISLTGAQHPCALILNLTSVRRQQKDARRSNSCSSGQQPCSTTCMGSFDTYREHHINQQQEAPGWSRHPPSATRQANTTIKSPSGRAVSMKSASRINKAAGAVSEARLADDGGCHNPTGERSGVISASSERRGTRRDSSAAADVDSTRDAGHVRSETSRGGASPQIFGDSSSSACVHSKLPQEKGRPIPLPVGPPPHLAGRTSHREMPRNSRIPSTRDGEKEKQRLGKTLDEGSPIHGQTERSDAVRGLHGSNDGAAYLVPPHTDSPSGVAPSGRGDACRQGYLSRAHQGNNRRSRRRINRSRSSSCSSNISNTSSDDDVGDANNEHLPGDLLSADSSEEGSNVRRRNEQGTGKVPSSERVFRQDRRPDMDDSRSSGGGDGYSSRQNLTREMETNAKEKDYSSCRRRNGHGKRRETSLDNKGRTKRRENSGRDVRRSRSGLGGGGGRRAKLSSMGHGVGENTAVGGGSRVPVSLSTTTKNHLHRRRRVGERPDEAAAETEDPPVRLQCDEESEYDDDDDNDDDDGGGASGGVIGPRSASRAHFCPSNRGVCVKSSRRGSGEAWGSESTATPSPRDPGGSVGEDVGSGGSNGGGLDEGSGAWLEVPRAEDPAGARGEKHRRGSRHNKSRGHHTSGTSAPSRRSNSSAASSPTNTGSTSSREGRLSSLDVWNNNNDDDDENENLDVVDSGSETGGSGTNGLRKHRSSNKHQDGGSSRLPEGGERRPWRRREYPVYARSKAAEESGRSSWRDRRRGSRTRNKGGKYSSRSTGTGTGCGSGGGGAREKRSIYRSSTADRRLTGRSRRGEYRHQDSYRFEISTDEDGPESTRDTGHRRGRRHHHRHHYDDGNNSSSNTSNTSSNRSNRNNNSGNSSSRNNSRVGDGHGIRKNNPNASSAGKQAKDGSRLRDINNPAGGWFAPDHERAAATAAAEEEEEEDEEGGDEIEGDAPGRGGAGAILGGGTPSPLIQGQEGHPQGTSLMLSYERGFSSDMVQCIIVRDRSGLNRVYPQYRFFFEGKEEQLMMVAHKRSKNRTSNYHVFDMQRGGFGTRLSKKNGNYLGKVRTNLKRTDATVFTNDQEVAELGAVSFEKPGLVDHLRDGSQPRKFSVLLPALDVEGAPIAHKVDPFDADSDMLSYIKQGRHGNMFPLETREPAFTNGNYRLNFHGRVTVPSVKNFQLISPDDDVHTVCQFGKVGEDRFHLDYRAPINAFQAFCISLAQFNF